jgi:hypothetical protein
VSGGRFPLPTVIEALPWNADYELESGKEKRQYDGDAERCPNPLAHHDEAIFSAATLVRKSSFRHDWEF